MSDEVLGIPTPPPEAGLVDSEFAAFMDFASPPEGDAPPVPSSEPLASPPATPGQPAAPAEGVGTEREAVETPPEGDGGQPPIPYDWPDRPTDWNEEASAYDDHWVEVADSITDRFYEGHRQAVIQEAREALAPQINALNTHPRLLVGTQVPSLTDDKMITLRDSQDAADWQSALSVLINQEVDARVEARAEESRDLLVTLKQSIELFQKNDDFVPGTKQFDKELVDRFAEIAGQYALRIDGRLTGYSIPVQPIVDSLRKQIQAERRGRPAVGTVPAPVQGRPRSVAAPQAGIRSKAGASGDSQEANDIEALWNTLDGPMGNFRV